MAMFKAAFVSLVVSLVSTSVAAKNDDHADLHAALKAQADAWDAAIIRKDREAIAKNMSETFFQIGSDGKTADKTQFLQNIMSPELVIAPYTVEDFKIRTYGNTALINGVTDMHGTYEGKPFRLHYRYTDTYVKEGGGWKVVNVQTTRIAE
ncbi:nuclear transport factor 2 family protein [Dyella sp. BiH032]|uniref:nuclear transport factor 2 family protein n=1 Tax=Dyella sp. BiH032 TaxID=3075430 RepID=UPI00289376D1|nr:nuclear transport factor 2 family protein [Dyella sp. BiH032]WNL44549.1 nuclear transport factor 2 family protein [Dyella sp. BiH032]